MIYGDPFDREAQVNRWLRRGQSGLIRGRSERAAPVRFARRSSSTPSGGVGPDGGDGLPGANGMSVGWKAYEQVGYRFAVSFGLGIGAHYTAGGVLATNDLNAVPYADSATGAGANSSVSFRGIRVDTGTAEANLFQVGLGNGRGGFSTISQFAISQVVATQRWFVGVAAGMGSSSNLWTGDPSSHINLIGVGQDEGDTSPQFMVNDGSGTATRSSTGLGTIAADTIYEVDVACSPFTTDAVISLTRFSGTVAGTPAVATFATNLPAVALSPVFYVNNGTGGGATRMDLVMFWCEIQPRAVE